MPNAATKIRESDIYDPKKAILDKVGDLSEVEIAQNEVLIATYMRPEKTSGGIILTSNNLKEDQYQGKVGLVLKWGDACRFLRTDPATGQTFGIPVKLHDWVVVRTSDTWPLEFNANPNATERKDFLWCRLVYDDQIRMRIPRPEIVW